MNSSGKNESYPLLGRPGSSPNASDTGEEVTGSGWYALLREARSYWRNKRRWQGNTSLASSSGEAASRLEYRLPYLAARVSGVLVVMMVLSMAFASLGAGSRALPRRSEATPSSVSSGGGDAGVLKLEEKMENTPSAVAPKGTKEPSAKERRYGRDGVNARVNEEMRKGSKKKKASASASPRVQVGDQVKPNVFFILIDDMGWEDIGYQNPVLRGVTPNLDKLAAGGIKMTNYYSMSICTPARASLMTGRYVTRYGFQYNIAMETAAPWGLPLAEKIFPEYMKDAGYETHMVGKWHLGLPTKEYLPHERGFDTFLGYLDGEETYWSHQTAEYEGKVFFDFGFGNATGYHDVILNRPFPEDDQDDSLSDDDDDDESHPATMTSVSSSTEPSGDGIFTGRYSTKVFQERTMEILKSKTPFDEDPLYLFLSHQAVHSPLGLPPEGSFSREEMALLDQIRANSGHDAAKRERFCKVLMYLDHTIGELVNYLEKEGWMENSIIVVASDNGACAAAGGSNYPLRGYKTTYFEGGYKVPAFVYSTSHIPQHLWGTEYNGMMHVTDWIPTIASAAGLAVDGGAGPLDGIDHWRTWVTADNAKYDSPRHELLYNLDPYMLWTTDDDGIKSAEYPLAQGAFRSGRYKFMSNVWCTGWYTFDNRTNLEDPLTSKENVCDGNPCTPCSDCDHLYYDYLFDIEADPREENNIIKEYPEIAETLRKRWIEVAFLEWTDADYKPGDGRAFEVWARNNFWMTPWIDDVGDVTEGLLPDQ